MSKRMKQILLMLLACLVFLSIDSPGIAKAAAPIDVLIDPGHGGIDGGTCEGDCLEKEINLDLATRLKSLLMIHGYETLLTRDKDFALSELVDKSVSPSRHSRDLFARRQMIRSLSPRITVSLHVNWCQDPQESGGYAYYYKFNPESKQLAETVQLELNQAFNHSKRKSVLGPYYILKNETVPTIIVEVGFASNAEDRVRLMSEQGREYTAEVVFNGIRNYLNNTKK